MAPPFGALFVVKSMAVILICFAAVAVIGAWGEGPPKQDPRFEGYWGA